MLNIPEEWKPFVNDYKMLLVEAKDNNLKLHNINNYNVPYKVDTISERDCLNGYLPLGEINYYC